MKKEGFVNLVEDIDNEVIVTGGIDIGSREFVVDENNLLRHTRWRAGAIGDMPVEKEVRIFTIHRGHCPSKEA